MISNSFRLIEDRNVKVDSKDMFSGLPEGVWVKRVELDRDCRALLPTYCLLLSIAGKNILVDTGLGQPDNGTRNGETIIARHMLLQGLKTAGLGPSDIDFVILTHLESDHLGGCARRDSDGNLFPSFPRARHLVQSQCWSEAISSSNTEVSPEEASTRSTSFIPLRTFFRSIGSRRASHTSGAFSAPLPSMRRSLRAGFWHSSATKFTI
ncbi:MAG: MBL fold metallo-hydrolase [SAR202 cluster bacterium]|nr:MBL fold metallo-hydrolase [SAR202 cluster bacterium]